MHSVLTNQVADIFCANDNEGYYYNERKRIKILKSEKCFFAPFRNEKKQFLETQF